MAASSSTQSGLFKVPFARGSVSMPGTEIDMAVLITALCEDH
jgi:hypothetical protein